MSYSFLFFTIEIAIALCYQTRTQPSPSASSSAGNHSALCPHPKVKALQKLNLYVAWVDGKNEEPDFIDSLADELEEIIEQPWVEEPSTTTNTPPNSPSVCPTELDSPSSDPGSDLDFGPNESEDPRPCLAASDPLSPQRPTNGCGTRPNPDPPA